MPSREWTTLPLGTRQILEAAQAELPVRLSKIAKEIGVSVKASTLPVGISGEIRPAGILGTYIIRINRHDSSRRQRFTAAHEISHFLLHKDQIQSGIFDDALYRSSLSDSREAEANRLAADILMPEASVHREMEAAKAAGIEDLLGHLADKFQVSEAAMRIRLGMN